MHCLVWLFLRVKLDFFKLHDEIYKQLSMSIVGKGSTGVTIWMDGLFHITRTKMEKKWIGSKNIGKFWFTINIMLLQVVLYMQEKISNFRL